MTRSILCGGKKMQCEESAEIKDIQLFVWRSFLHKRREMSMWEISIKSSGFDLISNRLLGNLYCKSPEEVNTLSAVAWKLLLYHRCHWQHCRKSAFSSLMARLYESKQIFVIRCANIAFHRKKKWRRQYLMVFSLSRLQFASGEIWEIQFHVMQNSCHMQLCHPLSVIRVARLTANLLPPYLLLNVGKRKKRMEEHTANVGRHHLEGSTPPSCWPCLPCHLSEPQGGLGT